MKKYEIEIDDCAVLVVVKQYDSIGDEVAISNIIPADEAVEQRMQRTASPAARHQCSCDCEACYSCSYGY